MAVPVAVIMFGLGNGSLEIGIARVADPDGERWRVTAAQLANT
jgi:hypothetical protein